jgi:predicted RNA-binding Zn-ribbon protein involved in translation (DUF1610 family)
MKHKHNHTKVVCSKCGKVIIQCRCIHDNQEVTYDICNECKFHALPTHNTEVPMPPVKPPKKEETIKEYLQEIIGLNNRKIDRNLKETKDHLVKLKRFVDGYLAGDEEISLISIVNRLGDIKICRDRGISLELHVYELMAILERGK